jgi:DNA-binding transcriptional MerR regulator
MAKRNREYNESEESTEVIDTASEVITDDVVSEPKIEKHYIEDMSDEEIKEFMQKRREDYLSKFTLKSSATPAYLLIRNRVRPAQDKTAELQAQINRLNQELRKKG